MTRLAAGLAVIALLVACSATPEDSPSPEPMATEEPSFTPVPATGAPALATPVVAYLGQRNYRDGGRFTAYELSLVNLADYPAELFSLGPAGLCASIRDAATTAELTQVCDITSVEQLALLSFSLRRNQPPPTSVYVELSLPGTSLVARSIAVALPERLATAPSPNPAPSLAAPGPDGWIGPERISTRNYSDLSLVIDFNGVAHAAAVLDSSIYYLTNSSGSWTRERLTRSGSTRRHYLNEDRLPTIGLDGDGSLWIAYTHEEGDLDCIGCTESRLRVLSQRARGWSQIVDRPLGYFASAQVQDGHVYLAINSGVVGDVLDCGGDEQAESPVSYTTDVTGRWTSDQLVDSGGLPVLALGSDRRARIAFGGDGCEGATVGVRFARATARRGGFQIETIPATSGLTPVALALDRQDRAHVLAQGDLLDWDEPRDTYYLRSGGGGWLAPELVFSGAEAHALALDATGAAHLLARRGSELLYATNRSGGFSERRFESGASWPWAAALAIDAQGRPHLLFLGNSELWYAVGPAN